MPNIHPTNTAAQPNTPTPSDKARGADRHPSFETELEHAERRLRYTRDHPMFGVHPDGVGPTLGQDLGRPNPGHDADQPDPDWNGEHYDPPT